MFVRLRILAFCVLCVLCAACGQRVGATVASMAAPGVSCTGQTYVLLPQAQDAQNPLWEEVAPMLRAQLEALGYVPWTGTFSPLWLAQSSAFSLPSFPDTSLQPRVDTLPDVPLSPAGRTQGAGGGAAGGVSHEVNGAASQGPGVQETQSSIAAQAGESSSGGKNAAGASLRRTAAPLPVPLTPPPGTVSAQAQTAGAADSTGGGSTPPDVVVRVAWGESGPYMELVPVPPWPYYTHHHDLRSRYFGRMWAADPFSPVYYMAEEKFVRGLVVEAVRLGLPPASDGAAKNTARGARAGAAVPLEETFLWRTEVRSKGNLSRAVRVLPELVRAALPWLGKTGQAAVRVQGETVDVVAGDSLPQ